MILKNPNVNILFDNVCITEQICIVLDGQGIVNIINT